MRFWPTCAPVAVCLLALGAPTWAHGEMHGDAAVAVGQTRVQPDTAAVDIRSLPLRDQHGKTATLRALEGRTLVMHFIFTHCVAACHTQVKSLKTVRAAFPAETLARVQFLSVSIDPERDTPKTLRLYGQTNGIDDGDWRFVTASPDVIERLTQHFAVKREATTDGQINHTLAVFLFDAGGSLIQRYADPVDVPRIVREIADVERFSDMPTMR